MNDRAARVDGDDEFVPVLGTAADQPDPRTRVAVGRRGAEAEARLALDQAEDETHREFRQGRGRRQRRVPALLETARKPAVLDLPFRLAHGLPSREVLPVEQRLPTPGAEILDAEVLPADLRVLSGMDLEREDAGEIDRVAMVDDRDAVHPGAEPVADALDP